VLSGEATNNRFIVFDSTHALPHSKRARLCGYPVKKKYHKSRIHVYQISKQTEMFGKDKLCRCNI